MKTYMTSVLIRPDPDRHGPDDRSSEGVMGLRIRARDKEQARRNAIHLVLSKGCLVSEFLDVVEIEKEETR